MFEEIQQLDSKVHADFRFDPQPDYGFAKTVVSAPLAVSEMAAAASSFPIVFPKGGKLLPVALLALSRGRNVFVSDAGEWLDDYVPAHIRRFPFILQETPDSQRYIVAIDPSAPQFSTGDDFEPLFNEAGEVPEDGVLTKAKVFLLQFQKEILITEKLLAPLEQEGVLVEQVFNVTRDGKTEVAVDGFRMVDMRKVAELDDSILAAWTRSGLMGVIYAHLHSQSHVNKLLFREDALVQPKPAKAASKKRATKAKNH